MSSTIRASIVCFDQALATSIIGISDLLAYCGVTWNYIHRQSRQPGFDVNLVSRTGSQVECVNGVCLKTHTRFEDVLSSDIVIVPTIGGNIDKTLRDNPAVISFLQRLNTQDTIIASNCTGAFFLAEAGLLTGIEATTHWGFVDIFRERYPDVELKPEKMLTHSGNILCSAGGHACFDMGLYLIERFHGHDTAIQSSKSFVLDMARTSQLSYAPIELNRQHDDDLVHRAQQYLDEAYQESVSLEQLAQRLNTSVRTLIRHFKTATGDTPLNYLQTLRLEHAKKLLESTRLGVSDITHAVGYDDISSFSRLFKRKTGLTPGHYRERYAPGSRSTQW